MSLLTETVLRQPPHNAQRLRHVATQFSPADIRKTIAELVSRDKLVLANALSDAGLSLYPDSQDILAISALLAEIQRDWGTAETLLEQLVELQGPTPPAASWRHLIRVQRCHCEFGKALRSAEKAVGQHPDNAELAQELGDLKAVVDRENLLATPACEQ
jgi:hypothetical protein